MNNATTMTTTTIRKCKLVEQNYPAGKCLTKLPDGSYKRACEATLKKVDGEWYRVIKSAHLSRPEHYFSIYMSGCCMHCLKCHSAEFTKHYDGKWLSTSELAELCYEYEQQVTVKVPREQALDWYATTICKCCGHCVLLGRRSEFCPKVLDSTQILFSPQGWGPARNIVGYTGGDLGCQPEFYVELTTKIKERCKSLWVLFETNGYALTPANLEQLRTAKVDSFWLDIKAYDSKVHKRLCGVDNTRILKLPSEIIDLGFELEILSLYIPGWVEQDQLVKIAKLIYEVDPKIPFTLLAFFPAYKLSTARAPTTVEMVNTYLAVKNIGLKRVRLGNLGVFARTPQDWSLLEAVVAEAL